jgi:hypothetical protein
MVLLLSRRRRRGRFVGALWLVGLLGVRVVVVAASSWSRERTGDAGASLVLLLREDGSSKDERYDEYMVLVVDDNVLVDELMMILLL